jgi:hypothetical protein
MINGNESLSRSTKPMATPGTINLKGLGHVWRLRRGKKPPSHPCSMKSVHQLDSADRGDEREPVRCSSCESFYTSEEDLHCHAWHCHVPCSWGRNKKQSPSIEKRLSLGGHPPRSNVTSEKGCSMASKPNEEHEQEKQQADKDTTTKTSTMPVVSSLIRTIHCQNWRRRKDPVASQQLYLYLGRSSLHILFYFLL